MANRHLARSIALQSLYEWDFKGAPSSEGVLREIVDHNLAEFAADSSMDAFVWELVGGIARRRPQLDRVIGASAPEWPIEQITIVDRNVLRLGLWELLFGDRKEVPPKVAINEAIELAKTFGSQSSGRFVNGVLGTVYRELADASDTASEAGRVSEDTHNPPEPAGGHTEQRAGVVVYRRAEGGAELAMITDASGHWSLVTGALNAGESPLEAARRHAQERLGVTGKIVAPLGNVEYAPHEDEASVRHNIAYYLLEAHARAGEGEGADEDRAVRWVPIDEVMKLQHYNNQDKIIEKAISVISK